jgi:hypothetical protein
MDGVGEVVGGKMLEAVAAMLSQKGRRVCVGECLFAGARGCEMMEGGEGEKEEGCRENGPRPDDKQEGEQATCGREREKKVVTRGGGLMTWFVVSENETVSIPTAAGAAAEHSRRPKCKEPGRRSMGGREEGFATGFRRGGACARAGERASRASKANAS